MRKLGLALALLVLASGAACAAYPEKNIQGYIMWGAGGAMDNVSRAIVPIALDRCKIDPAVAENLLYKHPAVMECAVIGMKDEKYGEEVAAAVTRKPGVETTEEELLAYMNGNMKPFYAPKRIFFFDALPKTGLGKILKREIRRIIHEPK